MAKKSDDNKRKTNADRAKKSAKKPDARTVSKVAGAAAASARRSPKKHKALYTILLILLVAAVLFVLAYGYYHGWFDALFGRNPVVNSQTYNVQAIANEQLSIHFLTLGNGNNGDCVYIKAGQTDVLIDAGSTRASADTIAAYVDRYCTDGVLEYVVATHADNDHISAFAGSSSVPGIFDRYKCNTIIQFARTNKNTDVYKDYCAKRDAEVESGAKCYTALECYNNANGAHRSYALSDEVVLNVLYQEFYEQSTTNENDYSVCLCITQGDNYYYLLGDLERAGELSLIEHNTLHKAVLYKGGHHGSRTSASQELMSVLQPQYVCVCCVAGSTEYTQNLPNTFPTQDFIDRVAPYTDAVYATCVAELTVSDGKYKVTDYGDLNGNIVFACTDGNVTMYFSASDAKLKDTEWFGEYRTCPDSWKSGAPAEETP